MHPDRNVLLASHTADMADTFGYAIRRCVEDYGQRLTGCTLDNAFRSRSHFRTSQGGNLYTSSPGASVAGKGASLLIGDDLVRDQAAASSPARRRQLFQWFNAEFLTRAEPGAKCVLIMSRRHPDDLSGALLAQNDELPDRDKWHRITLKAIGDNGAALWPARYPIQKLLDIQRGYEVAGQSHIWESLFQQNPSADSASLDWPAELFDGMLVPADHWMRGATQLFRVLAVDPSRGVSDSVGDFNGFADTTFDRSGKLWVQPQLHRLMLPQVEDTIVGMCKQTKYDACLIETNGIGDLLCANVLEKAKAQGVYVPLYRHNSTENKQVRIRLGLTRLLMDHKIKVHSGSQGARLLIDQLKAFPSGEFDDGPDSVDLSRRMIDQLLSGWRPTK